MNYFLYVRKSTDVEDKQVRSIEDQLAVLRTLAKEQNLIVVSEFVEKQSAKIPGRTIFTDMMNRIEKGEAQGIICWKLDRLARNPVDGGQVMWLLQRGVIQHIQTNDRSYRPSDNVMMMSMEFGMANQFILDLSSNTKRGLREKVKRGEYPSRAPVGYINDVRNKTILINKKASKAVLEAFELYVQGNSRLEDIALFLSKRGITTSGGRPLKKDQISFMLANPFYYGHFRYAGEMYLGRHTPIIPKKLFDGVQTVLKMRSRPQKRGPQPKALCGLFRCGECGCMITAEVQKGHTYYRCTKKSKQVKCGQKFIREELLTRQLTESLSDYVMPQEWAEELRQMAEKDCEQSTLTTAEFVQELRSKVEVVDQRLKRLLDGFLDQDIEQEIYRQEKAKAISEKQSLSEQITRLQQNQNAWLEPFMQWLKDARNLGEITLSPELHPKKSAALKICGSNPVLQNQKIVFTPQTQWAALRAAHRSCSETELCIKLARELGFEPRTHRLTAGCSTAELLPNKLYSLV